jgi:hypothetical protein
MVVQSSFPIIKERKSKRRVGVRSTLRVGKKIKKKQTKNKMPKSFWRSLKRPFFCVAPMANVTDVAFRRIISDLAKPTVSHFYFSWAVIHKRRRHQMESSFYPCAFENR